jgi:hypothetical protein
VQNLSTGRVKSHVRQLVSIATSHHITSHCTKTQVNSPEHMVCEDWHRGRLHPCCNVQPAPAAFGTQCDEQWKSHLHPAVWSDNVSPYLHRELQHTQTMHPNSISILTGLRNGRQNNQDSTWSRGRAGSLPHSIQTGDRRLFTKLVPTFADRGCHVVSMTDPYRHILGLLDRSRYCFFQVAPQLYSRGWVNPISDPLLLRKSGSAGNRTRTSGSGTRNSEHTEAAISF